MQRRATKSVKELKNKPSSETLALLHTSSLVKRRLRGDLIQAYRIIKELIRWISCTSSSWMMVVGYLRGHNLKVKVQRSRLQLRQKFFSQRVVCAWNSLPFSLWRLRQSTFFEEETGRSESRCGFLKHQLLIHYMYKLQVTQIVD